MINSYSSYFSGNYITLNNIQTRLILENNNFFIFSCFFLFLRDSLGGAILCKDYFFQIYLKDTTFFNCSATDYGGALYFSDISSSYCIEKCCAYYCFNDGTSTYPDGQFGYLKTLIGINQYLSMSYCSPEPKLRHASVLFYSSNLTILSTNSSNNYLKYRSLFLYYVTISNINFSIISNNIASTNQCFYLQRVISSIFYTNILNNTVGSGGVICAFPHSVGSTITFYFSLFLNNKLNSLFETSSSTIKVIDCWSDDYQITSGVTFSNTKGISSPFKLTFFKSAFCDALIPLNLNIKSIKKNIRSSKLIFFLNFFFLFITVNYF